MGNYFDHHPQIAVFAIGLTFGLTMGYGLKTLRPRKPKETDLHFEPTDSKSSGNYRVIIGVRTDLKMQKGKVAAQCAHAAVATYVKATQKAPDALRKWTKNGQAKITVKIDDEQEMLELNRLAKRAGILSCMIRDAGHTQVAPDSRTVIAIGPAPKEAIDKITGHLRLY